MSGARNKEAAARSSLSAAAAHISALLTISARRLVAPTLVSKRALGNKKGRALR